MNMKNPLDGPLTGKKILFATSQAIDTINPLTGLARYLQFAGCDVRWYAPAKLRPSLEKVEIQHYPFVHAKDLYVADKLPFAPERSLMTDANQRLDHDHTNYFIKRAPEYFLDLSDIYRTFRFSVLICDSFFSAIPFVRYKMSVPVVAVGIVPLAEESADLAPYGSGLPPALHPSERLAYASLRQKLYTETFQESIDLYSSMLDGNDIVHTRSPLQDTLIRQANLYLQIGPASFEYRRGDPGTNIQFIGGLYPPSVPGYMPHWFDARVNHYETVILVTQGCHETDPGKLLIPTLEAFRNNTDKLIIVTTGGHGTAALREQYTADNIIIENFIPFDDVMRHADVFVTNGGYGGVLYSLKYGVPIIAAGTVDHRNEVCARIEHFGCGIDLHVERPTSKALQLAVNAVLNTDLYHAKAQQFSEDLKTYDAFALCRGHIGRLLNRQESNPVTVRR